MLFVTGPDFDGHAYLRLHDLFRVFLVFFWILWILLLFLLQAGVSHKWGSTYLTLTAIAIHQGSIYRP